MKTFPIVENFVNFNLEEFLQRVPTNKYKPLRYLAEIQGYRTMKDMDRKFYSIDSDLDIPISYLKVGGVYQLKSQEHYTNSKSYLGEMFFRVISISETAVTTQEFPTLTKAIKNK